jgi:membrane associated rhomboid family serine protease
LSQGWRQMFFPYSTDAPIYHWPITTVLLIVVNVMVFCGEVPHFHEFEQVIAPYALEFGKGLQPLQWLTCNFLHGGVLHLVGNMLFLWSFGLIVEGKLGWYKTLVTYLVIGTVFGAIVQIIMLGSTSPPALGASAAIFGLMAMSLIWAPENSLQCVLWLLWWPAFFQVRVFAMVVFFLGFQILVLMANKMSMSSELLHAVGAAVGFPIGIWMLKAGIVDCEGWDVFSVWAGRHTMSAEEREKAEMEDAERKLSKSQPSRRREVALAEIRQIVGTGQALLAVKAHQRMTREMPDWTLPREDLWNLIRALQQQKLWAQSVEMMDEYLERYAEQANLVRLKLAQIKLLEQKSPAEALKVLSKVDEPSLDLRQREFFIKLRATAEQQENKRPGRAWA